ncbi:MAG: GtrA family protein [Acidimicrobiales bacterium]
METQPPVTTSSPAPSPAPSEETGVVAKVFEMVRHKGPKYVLVSVVNVLFGGAMLYLFQRWMNPVEANLLSVSISAVPAYYMSRSWVWGKKGKSHLKKEVLPFWIFVFAGLILSTIFISFADNHTKNRFVILMVQFTAFGILWVLRFFLFDKLFHVEINEDDTPDED